MILEREAAAPRTKRVALKAAAVILHDPAAEVEVGPMLDTREGILRGEELRRVIGNAMLGASGSATRT